jgi:putative OPT family oligopeptide transporter
VTSVIASSIVFLLLLGRDSELGSLLAILVGAVICCIVSVSGESMQDYKTGLILGNTPFKQQIAQLIGILLPSVTLPLVLSLIIQAYGIGKPSPEFPVPLMAPQANLIADVSRAIFFGTTPKWMICWGLAMAVVLLLIDFGLKVIGSSFRLKVLSVALGMYLPFENSITMSMGSLTGVLTFQFLQWYYPNNMPYVRKNVRFGMMFAAGVICGESITGILFAIPVAVSRDLYVLSVSGGPATNALLGMILLFLTLALHSLVIIYPALFSRYQDEVVEEDERPLVMLPRVHN